jgi:hypothetical protein
MIPVVDFKPLALWTEAVPIVRNVKQLKDQCLKLTVRVSWENGVPYIAKSLRRDGNDSDSSFETVDLQNPKTVVKQYPEHQIVSFKAIFAEAKYHDSQFMDAVLARFARNVVNQVRHYNEYKPATKILLKELQGLHLELPLTTDYLEKLISSSPERSGGNSPEKAPPLPPSGDRIRRVISH